MSFSLHRVQKQEGQEIVIAYGSKTLSTAERNYCVTRRELLALVYFVDNYRHYLIGRKFLIRTDHGALKWLMEFKDPEGQIARWIQRMSIYQFNIIHRPGSQHGNSDALSRIPCGEDCKFCKKGRQESMEEESIRARIAKELPFSHTRMTGQKKSRESFTWAVCSPG